MDEAAEVDLGFTLEVQQPGAAHPQTLYLVSDFDVRDDGVLVVRDAAGAVIALFPKGQWSSAVRLAEEAPE